MLKPNTAKFQKIKWEVMKLLGYTAEQTRKLKKADVEPYENGKPVIQINENTGNNNYKFYNIRRLKINRFITIIRPQI